jgi:GNAT superfamily N-acetyltransferase
MLKILPLARVPEHLVTLAQWHHRQWSYLYPDESFDDRLRRMQPHLHASFIPGTYVAIDSSPVGSASIIENDMETRPELTPWLASVYVKPDFRHRGIGRQLVNHIEKLAGEHNIRQLFLFTPDQQAFYQRLGWDTYDNTTYHDENVTIMVRDCS